MPFVSRHARLTTRQKWFVRSPRLGLGVCALLIAASAVLTSPAGAQRMEPVPPPCRISAANATLPAAPRPLEAASLAVLPLTVSAGGARMAYLSEAFADAVAGRLGLGVSRLDVRGRRAQRRHANGNAPATPAALGAELGAHYVLTGTITGSRDAVRLSLTLHDATSGRRRWTQTFVYDSAGVLPIEQTVAIEVASRVVGPLSDDERRRLTRVATRSHAAYEWAMRGDGALDTFHADEAGTAYRRAVQLDPAFADAYAKLALADAVLIADGLEENSGGVQLARELRQASDRALALDSTSATAWRAEGRARALEGREASAWRAAFERALALDPRDPAVLADYGIALAESGDRDAAREVLRRAQSFAPVRAPLSTSLAELAMADRRDADACVLLNEAIADDALFAPAWAIRALLRARHGDLRFAWADAETATRIGNTLLGESAAAVVDLVARDTSRARERLSDLWQQVRSDVTVGAREGRAVAVALLADGQISRALDVLEAVRPRGPWYAATLRDPSFDRLRNEPRFRALVTPPGLSPEARVTRRPEAEGEGEGEGETPSRTDQPGRRVAHEKP